MVRFNPNRLLQGNQSTEQRGFDKHVQIKDDHDHDYSWSCSDIWAMVNNNWSVYLHDNIFACISLGGVAKFQILTVLDVDKFEKGDTCSKGLATCIVLDNISF